MVFSISKLWNSLSPNKKLELLNYIDVSADNVDIGDFEDQYPSFQNSLKRKNKLIKSWKRLQKDQSIKLLKPNERLLKSSMAG